MSDEPKAPQKGEATYATNAEIYMGAKTYSVGEVVMYLPKPSRWARLLAALGLAKPRQPERRMVGTVSTFEVQGDLPPGWTLDPKTGELSFDPAKRS
jgi:hypothetical protein